jgi:hypothetical protein
VTLGEPRVERAAGGRDRGRAEVEARRLAAVAIEQIVRGAMTRTPPAMVERARTLLRRFFSAASWRIDDDTALASIVGPGSGWQTVVLDGELVVGFGWQAGSFRVDVDIDIDGNTAPEGATIIDTARGDDLSVAVPAVTDLGDTFDGAIVAEAQPQARVVRFLTGAGTGGVANGWIRGATATSDPQLVALFAAFPAISAVLPAPGCFSIEVHDATQWHDVLLPLLIHLGEQFASTRMPVVDRQVERARCEFAAVDVASPRGVAKVRDALTSPDATMRGEAMARIGIADPFAAERAWRAALDDTARLVRRAAVKAMASAPREALRPLLERAVSDNDSCTRYYAVRGLSAIGAAKSRGVLERLSGEGDARVRLAVETALNRR